MDSRDLAAVLAETLKIYRYHYPGAGADAVSVSWGVVASLYEGAFPGYRRCLVEYHDLRHTMDVLLASARLLDGHNLRATPLPEDLARSLLIAALLHDTGYIQEEWDSQGTGAKYTREHERRSEEFMRRNAVAFRVDDPDGAARMIRATDLKVDFAGIPFATQDERWAAAILGSADLLGQMGDREYLEKLLFLYYEFREAGIPGHETEFDILRKTRGFYEGTQRRLSQTLLDAQDLARLHFGERYHDGRNLYAVAIERQMAYLDGIIADTTTNFRYKLHRGDQHRLHAPAGALAPSPPAPPAN